MKLDLPCPSPDKNAYEMMLKRGLSRFPKRMDNYQKYLNRTCESIVDYLPVRMDYELVNRCNFRCSMCTMSVQPNGRGVKDTTYEEFKESLDEMYGLVEVKLQGIGEPLLNKSIFKMIQLASDRDIWTRLTVNGSLLHINENYKKLVESNPGEIQISIDGASKDVYEKIRKGSDFDRTIENATILNKYVNSMGLLKTRCWTVVQKENFHQLFEMVSMAAKMEFKRITFSIYLSGCCNDDIEKRNAEHSVCEKFTREKGLELVEYGKKLGLEVTFWDGSNKFKITEDKRQLCSWLFERAFISSEMRVVPCCTISSPGILDFGDAKRIVTIWNGREYQEFRDSHINNRIPKLCTQCYYK